MFIIQKLQSAVYDAKGDRSMRQYAIDADVDPSYLSKIVQAKLENPPSPDILKKLSESAKNGITYDYLMKMAGHIEETQDEGVSPELRTLKENLQKYIGTDCCICTDGGGYRMRIVNKVLDIVFAENEENALKLVCEKTFINIGLHSVTPMLERDSICLTYPKHPAYVIYFNYQDYENDKVKDKWSKENIKAGKMP